ncbi:NUDIX hydrolase [Aquibacillus saliphilus]|uniref:NUDIX hydrolase n=1 Tax=Aquibacillus saliphilus TaxID=1909422 RepID=UPI001CEFBFA5|nr:NUDIX hydrolase [Aquibacillus saliphilus]
MANYISDLRKDIGSRPIIMVGAGIMVFNDKNELLLQLRSDTFDWGLPGGAMELGESFEDTARRELYEETGLDAGELELVDLLSGQEFHFKYPNGDQVYNAIGLFRTYTAKGQVIINDNESCDLQYFAIDNLPENLHHTTEMVMKKYKKE